MSNSCEKGASWPPFFVLCSIKLFRVAHFRRCAGLFMPLRWSLYAAALVSLCRCAGLFMPLRWALYAAALGSLCRCAGLGGHAVEPCLDVFVLGVERLAHR